MLLHKRCLFTKNPIGVFGAVRVPHDVDIIEGSHVISGTALPDQMTVVATGRHSVDEFGGISISTFGPGESHDVNGFVQMPQGITDPMTARIVDSKGKRRDVYKCFVVNQSDLPENFDVHPDRPPEHALIYNTIDTVLEEVVERPSENAGHTGTFRIIQQLPWRFCCYLMQIRGGGDVPDIEFSDPEMGELIDVLYVCRCSVTFEDESEPYDALTYAINGYCAQDTTLRELPELLPASTFLNLLDALSMHSALVDFEDESLVSSRLESILRSAADARETDADFPEYIQVIQAKVQHVSSRDERLIVKQCDLELANLIRDKIDVGCPYQVFVTAGASVNFVVLSRSNEHLVLKDHTMTLRTAEMSYELTLCVVTDEVDIELDECSRGCIVNAFQYDSSSSDTVLIGMGRTGKTIAVALGKIHLPRIQLGTEQCFGYRLDGKRCQNRRFSGGRPHVWCNHHTSQIDKFSRYSKATTTDQSPEWWITAVPAASAVSS